MRRLVDITEARTDFKPGDQIAYVPLHAGGNLNHDDVEFGFVTSTRGDTVFCRFWSKYSGGLRNVANSEGAHKSTLRHYASRPEHEVREYLRRIHQ